MMSENRWGLPLEPTNDQVAAIEAIIEWWNEGDGSDSQVFRLFGYAGTGKTSIAIYLPHILGVARYKFGAFSGKAVNVLQSKMTKAQHEYTAALGNDEDAPEPWAYPASPENCGTLHSLLYGPPVDLKKVNADLETKIDVLQAALRDYQIPDEHERTPLWPLVVHHFQAAGRRNMNVGFGGLDFTADDARDLIHTFEDEIASNTRIAKVGGWLYFAPQEQSPLLDVDLLIADEVSMVSDAMAQDILSTGVRVLVLGDPEQLPPVRGNGYFVQAKPDAMLQTVTRQAAGSPVLSIATQVRAGVDTDTWTVPWRSVDHASFADDDAVILCWRRATRWGAVKYVRETLLGRPAGVPVPGDKIMVLANNKDIGVYNGQCFVVDEVEEPPVAHEWKTAVDKDGTVPAGLSMVVEGDVADYEAYDPDVIRLVVHEEGMPDSQTPLEVYRFGFLGDQEEKDAGAQRLGMRGRTALATFAQAVTVHKAQGSEWGRVLFIDEGRAMFSMEANRGGYDYADRQTRRFRYTAITRARDEVVIVRKS